MLQILSLSWDGKVHNMTAFLKSDLLLDTDYQQNDQYTTIHFHLQRGIQPATKSDIFLESRSWEARNWQVRCVLHALEFTYFIDCSISYQLSILRLNPR